MNYKNQQGLEPLSAYQIARHFRAALLNTSGRVLVSSAPNVDALKAVVKHFEENYERADPTQLTEAEMDELSFGRWEPGNPMRLLPVWFCWLLPDEFEAERIDGERRTFKRGEMDNDDRFGFLPYGVFPREK